MSETPRQRAIRGQRNPANISLVTTTPAPDASATSKGVVKLSVASASGTDPIAAGDNDPRLSDARIPLSHTHAAGDIVSGTIATARLPLASSSGLGIVQLATSGASVAGQAVDSTDTRLSNPRTPTAHTHLASDIVSGVFDAARLPAGSTSAAGIVRIATSGTSIAGYVVDSIDSRLSDTRTPTAHVHSGADITTGTVPAARLPAATTTALGIGIFAANGNATAGRMVQADDSRLSDARTPLAHTHSAADITSGTLAAARLPTPIPQVRAGTIDVPAMLLGAGGTYKFQWTNPLPDTNYSAQATPSANSGISINLRVAVVTNTKTTTSCEFQVTALSALTTASKLEVQIIANQL